MNYKTGVTNLEDLRVEISILIPVFNGQDYIHETLESVLNNTEQANSEIILINDGSSDQTREICLRFSDRINYLEQINQGESAAINLGLKMAKGKYILVVSHDDPMLSPELIPKAINILERNMNLVCAYPDWQIIDSVGKVVKVKSLKEYSEDELIGRYNCLPGPGAIFRREQALEIGGRREWKYVGDYDFWLRLSRLGEFKRIPEVLAQWRSHPNSTTVSNKSLAMGKERIGVIETFLRENHIEKKLSSRAISSAYYFASRLGVFSNQLPSKKWMAKSFRARHFWPDVANPIVVLYIFLKPASDAILRLFSNFPIIKKYLP